jgi:hypothetical protein
MRWVDVPNVGAAETLDRRKDMLEPLGPFASNPPLAKGCFPERVPEGGTALVDDFLAVRNKQKAAARELLAEPRIVDRRHHSLSRTRSSHQEVSMVALMPGEDDMLEQGLLERA